MKTIPFNIKKVFFNEAGQASFIEFAVGFMTMIVLLIIVFQVYGLMHAETIAMNAAKDALRRVELNGGRPVAAGTDLLGEVKNELGKIKGININTVQVTVQTPTLSGETPIQNVPKITDSNSRIQLRDYIMLRVMAEYDFKLFGATVASVPIAITYTGSSAKFNKNSSATYSPVLDN